MLLLISICKGYEYLNAFSWLEMDVKDAESSLRRTVFFCTVELAIAEGVLS
jgi:hypothetical protein